MSIKFSHLVLIAILVLESNMYGQNIIPSYELNFAYLRLFSVTSAASWKCKADRAKLKRSTPVSGITSTNRKAQRRYLTPAQVNVYYIAKASGVRALIPSIFVPYNGPN